MLSLHFLFLFSSPRPFIFSPSFFSLSLHKAKAFGSVDGTLTEDMMDSGVKDMVEQHKQKVFWEKGSS